MANEAASNTIAKAIVDVLEPRPTTSHPARVELAEHQQRAQAFFQSFGDSIRPVHVGEERRAFVKEMLLRAQEAQLFDPTQEPK